MTNFVSQNRGSVDKCDLRVITPATTELAVIGDYYQIAGTFADGEAKNFSVASNGTITYNGKDNSVFQLTGASDVEVNKACTITYAIEKNGVIDTASITPHTFVSTSKIANISICRIVSLNNGDI